MFWCSVKPKKNYPTFFVGLDDDDGEIERRVQELKRVINKCQKMKTREVRRINSVHKNSLALGGFSQSEKTSPSFPHSLQTIFHLHNEMHTQIRTAVST